MKSDPPCRHRTGERDHGGRARLHRPLRSNPLRIASSMVDGAGSACRAGTLRARAGRGQPAQSGRGGRRIGLGTTRPSHLFEQRQPAVGGGSASNWANLGSGRRRRARRRIARRQVAHAHCGLSHCDPPARAHEGGSPKPSSARHQVAQYRGGRFREGQLAMPSRALLETNSRAADSLGQSGGIAAVESASTDSGGQGP